jgi:hypothetical protein
MYGAGDLDGVSYLLKYTTLEHMQADQVAKLPSDIIHRRLVQVRERLFRREQHLRHFPWLGCLLGFTLFTGSASLHSHWRLSMSLKAVGHFRLDAVCL